MITNSQNIPQGYKATALGVIPQEWKAMRLGDVCTLINGRAYKQNELLSQGKYKILRVGNFFTNESWYFSDMELDSSKYAFKGDLLYAWSASFGPRFWTGDQVIYHYHIWKICNYRGVDQQYLYYFLDYDASLLQRDTQGGTMHHITKQSMEKRFIPVPPLGEQRKIAEVLGVWDLAIAKQVQLVERLTERKRALMQRLLTAKLRLPGFSAPWKKVKLREICERVTRKNIEDNQNVMTISAQRGFVAQTDFFNKSVASETLESYYLVFRDEFCYNKSYSNGYPMGAIKRLSEANKAVVTSLYICFNVKPETDTNIDYLSYYFDNGGLNRGLTKIANEGGRAHGLLNVTPKDFFGLSFEIPSLKEQTAIAEVLTAADREIELAQAKLELYRRQKRGLMQQLLTGKKRI